MPDQDKRPYRGWRGGQADELIAAGGIELTIRPARGTGTGICHLCIIRENGSIGRENGSVGHLFRWCADHARKVHSIEIDPGLSPTREPITFVKVDEFIESQLGIDLLPWQRRLLADLLSDEAE